MRTTPSNIRQQEFNKTLRGYDTEEVKGYLNGLAEELDEILTENEWLKRQLDEALHKLAEYRKMEKSLQETVVRVQENSQRALESTRKQASIIMKEAEIKANQMVERARETANEIRNSIIHLREERDLIVSRLKAIVSSQSSLLDLKIEKADEEVKFERKPSQTRQIEINIDDLLDKLL